MQVYTNRIPKHLLISKLYETSFSSNLNLMKHTISVRLITENQSNSD